MPVVRRTVDIAATPERVFDLIDRVEQFPRYFSHVKTVTRVAPDLYRWQIGLAGIPFEWTGRVVERQRPRRFAWQSVSGLANRGSYLVEPHPGGTRVTFTLEYELPLKSISTVVAPLLEPVVERLVAEGLLRIRRRLEESGNLIP